MPTDKDKNGEQKPYLVVTAITRDGWLAPKHFEDELNACSRLGYRLHTVMLMSKDECTALMQHKSVDCYTVDGGPLEVKIVSNGVHTA